MSARIHPREIAPAPGRVGVLLAGMGSVASTLVAGVALTRRGLAPPVGSLTQLQRVGLDGPHGPRAVRLGEVAPLAGLDQLVFGGWDPLETDALSAARASQVVPPPLLEAVEGELRAVECFPAAFEPRAVPCLSGVRVKQGRRRELVEQLRDDLRRFRRRHELDRLVVCFLGSTEVLQEESAAVASLPALERALDRDDPDLAPTLLYAYAALCEGVPFVNGTPNRAVEAPALIELALARGVPTAGKDLKTGQTMLKTALAPALQARALGLSGWYSANILGNRDGQVLADPGSFRAKEATKRGALEGILRADLYPELYGDYCHTVRIDYYPPRGDQKEGWDNIDIFGWLGLPMQIKLDFLCRDSILAAPLALDLVLLADLARRAGLSGLQEWLGFYFKCPGTAPGGRAEHDLFRQHARLVDTLCSLGGVAPLQEAFRANTSGRGA